MADFTVTTKSGQTYTVPWEGEGDPSKEQVFDLIKSGKGRLVSQPAAQRSGQGGLGTARQAPPEAVRGTPPKSLLGPLGGAGGGVLGGMGGAALGGALGGPPGAVLGGMLGAGGGALGGEEVVNRLLGTPSEPKERLGTFLAGAAGEGVGQAIGAGAKALTRGGRSAESQATSNLIRSTAQREGIPLRAGDITLSRPIMRVENAPTYFVSGAGPVQRFAGKQIQAAEQAATRLARSLGPETDKMTVGLAAKGEVQQAVKAFNQQRGDLFRQIEQMAGDTPVVEPRSLRTALEHVMNATEQGTLSAPPQASRLERRLSGPTIGLQGGGGRIERMSPEQMANLPPGLQQILGGGNLTFANARNIESELGETAFRGGKPIGNIPQGRVRELYRAVRDDLDRFMSSPTADPNLRPKLDEAKQVYRIGRQHYNDSMRRLVTGQNVDPEKIVSKVFAPGNTQNTIDFKISVSDPVYQQATMAWMSDMVAKSMSPKLAHGASVQGFSPQTFVRRMTPYIQSGQLDVILEPGAAQSTKNLVEVFSRLGRAEKLIASGQAAEGGWMTMNQLAKMAGLAAGGYVAGGGEGALASVAAPYAVAKATTSKLGIRALSGNLSRHYPETAVRTAAQLISQGSVAGMRGGEEQP